VGRKLSLAWTKRLQTWLKMHPKRSEELLEHLKQWHKDALINTDTYNILEGVLLVGNMRVRDVMVPKTQMVTISEDAQLGDILPIVTESGHSRFPVTGESRDEIIGILHAKELLRFNAAGNPLPSL
jgi:Putative Mg2+ and Co2+ transporter CorC